MGIRPRRPSASPEPQWGPESRGPGSAKRPRLEEHTGPEALAGTPAATALTSVVVLAAGCALRLPLDNVELLLEPEPSSVLQVTLQGHTYILVPENLLCSTNQSPGGQGNSPGTLELGTFPGACRDGDGVVVQPELLCASVPEIAAQEEAYQEDSEAKFPAPGMDPPAGSAADLLPWSARRPRPHPPHWDGEPCLLTPSVGYLTRSPDLTFDDKNNFGVFFSMFQPFPSSPLQPLPPFPSPGPQEYPAPRMGPHRKARRRLFQE
ncbi:proline-rich protein 23A-like [Ctenodactylus gundi]